MSIIEKTKYLVSEVSPAQGIKGLFKLQDQATGKAKKVPRLACLGLMEMEHDWENIRKCLVQWKFTDTFGKDLINRMRKRVGEEPGATPNDEQAILKQLDRLNSKSWKLYSPKKQFPQYFESVKEGNNEQKESKPQKLKEEQKMEEKKKLFNRVTFNSEAPISKENPAPGIFKLQFNKGLSASNEQLKQELDKPEKQAKQTEPTFKSNPDKEKLEKDSGRQPELSSNISQTPKYKQHHPVKVKINYENSKAKDEASRDQFSFSAIKSRQVPHQSNKKSQYDEDEFAKSFLEFTNESKKSKQIFHEKLASAALSNVAQQSVWSQKNEVASLDSAHSKIVKPLFTEQELSLIQMSKPPKNHINMIMRSERKSAMLLLDSYF